MHTKEPWRYENGVIEAFRETNNFGERWEAVVMDRGVTVANARRIVACVNACAGIPTEALEAGDIGKILRAVDAFFDGAAVVNNEKDTLYVRMHRDLWENIGEPFRRLSPPSAVQP